MAQKQPLWEALDGWNLRILVVEAGDEEDAARAAVRAHLNRPGWADLRQTWQDGGERVRKLPSP